jgi:hypothetical protein
MNGYTLTVSLAESETAVEKVPPHALREFASPDFWHHYRLLPKAIQNLADRNYKILKLHPENLNLRLKKVGYG